MWREKRGIRLRAMSREIDVPAIVLTGGPCSGKTTALCYVEEKLRDWGYNVFIIREAATKLLNTGISPKNGQLTREQFEEAIFEHVLWETKFYRNMACATNLEKKIIVCDRGLLDIKAYAGNEIFQKILEKHGLSIVDARDKFYTGIFHLRTIAFGKEDLWDELWGGNAIRIEQSPEEARTQDEKTLCAWNGHPHIRVIDNSTDFEGKLRRLMQAICRIVGIPVPLEIERKFRISDPQIHTLPVPVQVIDIEQAYLMAPDETQEHRIRKRGQSGTFVYYKTTKQNVGHGIRIETEKHISIREYEELLRYRDPRFSFITKKRCCFFWKDQYFELDVFIDPHPGLCLLEIELTEGKEDVEIPPFVEVLGEVTDNYKFSNRELARVR